MFSSKNTIKKQIPFWEKGDFIAVPVFELTGSFSNYKSWIGVTYHSYTFLEILNNESVILKETTPKNSNRKLKVNLKFFLNYPEFWYNYSFNLKKQLSDGNNKNK